MVGHGPCLAGGFPEAPTVQGFGYTASVVHRPRWSTGLGGPPASVGMRWWAERLVARAGPRWALAENRCSYSEMIASSKNSHVAHKDFSFQIQPSNCNTAHPAFGSASLLTRGGQPPLGDGAPRDAAGMPHVPAPMLHREGLSPRPPTGR